MIDVATGEFFATHVDHELSGVVPLSLGRRFSTSALAFPVLEHIGDVPRYEPFGPGWRPAWWAELRKVLGGFVYVRADGTEYAITEPRGSKDFERTGRLVAPGHALQLERIDTTRLRLVGFGSDRGPTSVVFAESGTDKYRLIAFERTRAGRVDLTYDERGRPAHLHQIREQRGYSFTYDAEERIVEAQWRLPDRSRRLAARYEYGAAGRLMAVHDARGMSCLYGYDDEGRLVRDETRGGKLYTIRYDRHGRCVYASGSDRYEERRLKFDETGHKTWVTNSHGHVTSYEYNAQGQVVKTTSPTGEVTRAEFDEYGRLSAETLETGEHQRRAYDELGRLVSLESSYGTEKRCHFDEAHRLVVAEDWTRADGGLPLRVRTVRFAYDQDHNVISKQDNTLPPWRYEWTTSGELAAATDPAGARRTWSHDDRGNVEHSTDEDGAVWRWTHDVMGRNVSETDPLGGTRTFLFDDEGLSVRARHADGRRYERYLSPDERLEKVVLPGGAIHTTQRNSCGWPTEICDEVGAVTRLRWGTEPGELLAIVDSNQAEFRFEYDSEQRVVRRVTFDGRALDTEWKKGRVVATIDAAGQRTELVHDSSGRVAEEVRGDGTTKREYDASGRLVALVSPEATLRFERDSNGRIIAEDQDGIRLERTLDVMGRPLSYHSDHGVDTTFGWSASGACSEIRHGDGHVMFTRDALGREVQRSLAGAGRLEQRYDSVGRLTSQLFHGPDGGGGVQRDFAYDSRAFLLEIQDSLRGRTELRHNDRGDLTGVLRERGWSDVAAFDDCRNRVYYARTEHTAALAEAFRASERNRAQGFDEVPVDRIMAALPHHETAQGYARGNRTVSLDHTDGTRIELAYDANGCVVAKTRRQGARSATWRYGWDSRGRMTTMTAPDGAVWRYRYDGTDRRIEKQSPTGEMRRYTWRGQDLAETLNDGKLLESYVHEPGGTCPVLRRDASGIHYILPDQSASPSEEIAIGGGLGWQSRKGTWAEGWQHHGYAGGEPFLGQWYDAESGLHYNRFRYYDPDTGRFLSPDPIGLEAGHNLYLSVTSPLEQYDRYGLALTPCGPKAGEELADIGNLSGKKKKDIEDDLKQRGFTEVPGFGGGTVWTKDTGDGSTAAVRLDPAKVRTPALNYADEVDHAHKEVVATSDVTSGNYRSNKAQTLDDAGKPSNDPRQTHLPLGP